MTINTERLEQTFYSLLRIKGMSFKEREVADYLINHFKSRGIEVKEDDAKLKAKGNSGNIIVRMPGKGKGKDKPGLCFLTHMDTVKYDDEVRFRKDNGIIYADGSQILGADDRAGIAMVLEMVECLREGGNDHPPLVLVFTIAEECGLVGAGLLDIKALKCSAGFVLDCSLAPGNLICQAPGAVHIKVVIKGMAAHAGIAPESGLSALSIMAEALRNMRLGRIDEDTTANWGVVQGGRATNIVMAELVLNGEARSLVASKLEKQVAHMKEVLEEAVKLFVQDGFTPELLFEVVKEFSPFNLSSKDEPVALAIKAIKKLGIEPVLTKSGGGSDANVLNNGGLPTVNLAIGMEDVHGPKEHIKLADINAVAEILLGIVEEGLA